MFRNARQRSLGLLGLASAICSFVGSAAAQPAHEPFSYPADSPIHGKTGGTGWGGAWSGSANFVVAPGLTYPGLAVAGNALGPTPGSSSSRALAAPVVGKAGSSLVISALIRSDVNGTPETQAVLGNSSGGMFTFGDLPQLDRSAGNWGFQTSSGRFYSKVPVAANVTTYLVVQIDFDVNGNNDRIRLWVNPPADSWRTVSPAVEDSSGNVARFAGIFWQTQQKQVVDEIRILASDPAAASPPLLVPDETPGPRPRNEPIVVRARNVRVNLDLLRPEARGVSVPLFDGASIEVVLERREKTRGDGFVWIGRIAGQPQSLVMFSVLEGVLIGDIQTERGEQYQIRYLSGAVHVLRQVDPRRYPPEGNPPEVQLPPEMDTSTAACPMTDPADEIDTMVVYTPSARTAAGGPAAMEAEVYLAVSKANVTYINSGIHQRLRLVHTAEVAYTETPGLSTAAMTTDRDRLRIPGDGFVDGVHALRDAHGADIVAMIGEYPPNYPLCGIAAMILNPVVTTLDIYAFTVVQRSCASGNLTLAHELGHLMGARHEWAADSNNNAPYAFNHGYFLSQSAWRTVMATVSAGGNCCTRIPHWSNPAKTYGGSPTGTATGQPTDNAKTLNQTAQTVANFRCSSPGRADVWMKDTWSDTGVEPDPVADDMWKSPYIWIRNSQDTTLVHQHEHEDPEFGATNWIYTKLHNAGGAAASGELELYVAKAVPFLQWPAGWTKIASVTTSVPAHATKIVEAKWENLPGQGHYCMIARWISPADPMKFPETTDFNANTRNNNNIVWRNLNIVNLQDAAEVSLEIRNPLPRQAVYSLSVRAPRGQGNHRSFLRHGRIKVEFSSELFRSWVRGGRKGKGFRDVGCRTLQLTQLAGVVFENLVLKPGQVSTVTVYLERPRGLAAGTYFFDVVQHDGAGKDLGGVGYEVRVGAASAARPAEPLPTPPEQVRRR